MVKKNIMFVVLFGLINLMGMTAVHAASFSINGGVSTTLNEDFDLWEETGLSIESIGYSFDSENDGRETGLTLSGAATEVSFTFLGSEADADNYSFATQAGDEINFDSNTSEFGDTETLTFLDDGLLSFNFLTYEETCHWFWGCSNEKRLASNDGLIDGDLSILFFQENAHSIIALFGDGRGDNDYDDMAVRISVTAVPLPPSLLLFGGALLGLGWVARKKKLNKSA